MARTPLIGARNRVVWALAILFFAAAIDAGVAEPSSASTTLTGQISWLIRGGFSLFSGNPCGHVPISIGGATIVANGQTVSPGIYAQATGSGSCASMTATQVVLSARPLAPPAHILTADYLGTPYGSTAFSWWWYATWLSWAETFKGDTTAIASTGIRTMFYTNPNRESPPDVLYTPDETTFAHTCSGSRITNIGSTRRFLMNPGSVDLRVKWNSLVNATFSTSRYAAVFEDDADDVGSVTALPCGYTPASWLALSQAENGAMDEPVIYNGLGVLSPNYGISYSIGLNTTSLGGMMEACYTQPGSHPKVQGKVWRTEEDTEILMAQQKKLFLCYANETAAAATSQVDRLYTLGSFLLTYDLDTSVLWEYFSNPSRFHVEPESVVVPTTPVVPEPATIVGLLTTSGLYARQYLACYVVGEPVGPCAVVVNPDYAHSHAFPYAGYDNTLTLIGGGVLDGGKISISGPAPSSYVPPLQAVIAFK